MKMFRLTVTSACLLATGMACAQEAEQTHNFALGPLLFDLTGFANAEYSNNFNRSGINEIEDVRVGVGLAFNGVWEMSERNTLTASITTQYWTYLDNSELSSSSNFLDLSDDSELAFNIYLGDVVVTVRDTLAFSSETNDAVGIDNQGSAELDLAKYARFENTASIGALWEMKYGELSGRIEREDTIPIDNEFDFVREEVLRLAVGLTRELAKNLKASTSASVFDIKYPDSNVRNDAKGASADISAVWELSDLWTLSGLVGVTSYDFENTGTIGDASSPAELDFKLRLSHQWSPSYNHAVYIARGSETGYLSNIRSTLSAGYQSRYDWTPDISLNTRLEWQQTEDSGGILDEGFDRYLLELSAAKRLTKKAVAYVSLEAETRESDAANRDYDRYLAGARLSYDF